MRRQPEDLLRDPLPAEGVPVPLRASFLGLAGVPLVALAKNNLSARLALYPDRLEHKVFRDRRRAYGEIRRVDVETTLATRNVELVWQGSVITFTANVRTDAWRLALLRYLEARGAPLAPGAVELLRSAAGAPPAGGGS